MPRNRDRVDVAQRALLYRAALCCCAAFLAGWGSGCAQPQSIGDRCSTSEECDSHLQCLDNGFQQVCVPRCAADVDCGEGFRCSSAGACEVIVSRVGDACERELDCGPWQACQPIENELAVGNFAATCVAEYPGATIGVPCDDPSDCRNGICAYGIEGRVCSQLCLEDEDCPHPYSCDNVVLHPIRPDDGSGEADIAIVRGCDRQSKS